MNRLVEPGESLAAAIALAADLARFPQRCLRSDRLSAHRQWGLDLDAALALETELGREVVASVRERAPAYSADASATASPSGADGLSGAALERLAARLVDGFADRGLTRTDVDEAIRWARGGGAGRGLGELRGAISVEPGDVVEDVKRARSQRGRNARGPQ